MAKGPRNYVTFKSSNVMKIYIFQYLDEQNHITKELATASEYAINYAIQFAKEKQWKFRTCITDVKTQGENYNTLSEVREGE